MYPTCCTSLVVHRDVLWGNKMETEKKLDREEIDNFFMLCLDSSTSAMGKTANPKVYKGRMF